MTLHGIPIDAIPEEFGASEQQRALGSNLDLLETTMTNSKPNPRLCAADFPLISLPREIGARPPGLHLAAILVFSEGKAELVTVFDDLPPSQMDAFIVRVLR